MRGSERGEGRRRMSSGECECVRVRVIERE